MSEQTNKVCNVCKQVLEVGYFTKNGKRGYYGTCKLCKNIRAKEYRAGVFKKILEHYGKVCAECGTSEGLEINHLDGNGKEHRESLNRKAKMTGINFWIWLIKNNFPEGFNTLCGLHNKTYKPKPEGAS